MNADDLLRRALEIFEVIGDPVSANLYREIERYLDAPKDEPVAWIPEDELSEGYPYDVMFPYSKVDIIRWFPVYGPKIKTDPMTKEEIDSKFALDGSMFSSYTAFKQGIRFAERHHGIGGGDND